MGARAGKYKLGARDSKYKLRARAEGWGQEPGPGNTNTQLILQESSILEVRLGSKYILSIDLLLDRFGQSNKFRKKSKKKFRDSSMVVEVIRTFFFF